MPKAQGNFNYLVSIAGAAIIVLLAASLIIAALVLTQKQQDIQSYPLNVELTPIKTAALTNNDCTTKTTILEDGTINGFIECKQAIKNTTISLGSPPTTYDLNECETTTTNQGKRIEFSCNTKKQNTLSSLRGGTGSTNITIGTTTTGGGGGGGGGETTTQITGTLNPPTTTTQTIPPTATLTINTIGNGQIDKNDNRTSYPTETHIQITATADSGWIFSGWNGDITSNQNPITIILDTNKNITANFTRIIDTNYNLTLNTNPAEAGRIDTNDSRTNYPYGMRIQITAIANTGWRFENWEGNATGTQNPLTIVMDSNKTITANFVATTPGTPTAPSTYALITSASPAEGGSIDVNDTRQDYNSGSAVLLTAVPASAEWVFDGWGGSVSGNQNPLTLIMDSNKTIIAHFSSTSLRTEDIIGSWTKSVLPGETVLLVGKNLDTGSVVVNDGVQEAQATVLMREGQKLMAVIPSTLGSGTLRLKLQGSDFASNEVLLNAPEPWWVQPDRLNVGESTRIFGRNLNSAGASATVGDSVAIVLKNAAGTEFNYIGTVIEPNAIRFTVSGSIAYGDYNLFVKEPKNSNRYGPLKITLAAAYQMPSYTRSVLDFGATPDDSSEDNAAFNAALLDVSSHGGGILNVPAGTFLIVEQPLGNPPGWQSILLRPNVHLKGAGVNSTIIEFKHAVANSFFNGLVLLENTSVENLTLKVSSNVLSTGGDPTILYIRGNNARAKNVKIDADNSSIDKIFPVKVECDYCKVEDSKVYSEGTISFVGRQIELRNITHYGAREMQHYVLTGSEPRWFSGAQFHTAGGASEIIVENNNAVSRWAEVAMPEWQGVNRGSIRTFFTGAANQGGVSHAYFGNNTADVIGLPFSDSENFLFEPGCENFYYGGFTVDAIDKTLVSLNSAISSGNANRIRTFGPRLLLVVADGTGLGQVREGFLQPGDRTIKINERFIVEPDSTSKIAVMWAVSENIIYGNNFQSRHSYSTGGFGIAFWGKVVNTIVGNNKITGFPIGFADAAISCNYWENKSGFVNMTAPNYFNEVVNNEITDSTTAITTNYFIPSAPSPDPLKYWDPNRLLGNVYRHNLIESMNLALPQFGGSREPYSALGISNNRVDKTRPSATSIVGSIYEFNNIDSSRRVFFTEKNFADWLVVRKNNFSNPDKNGIMVVNAMPHAFLQENTLNVKPQITITSSPDPANIKFKCLFGNPPTTNPAHATEPILLTDTDCYIWSSAGSGSVTLSFSDLEGNPIINKSVSGSASLSGDLLSWTGLNNGVHELIVSASDGTATGERRIFLLVGAFDGFESSTTNVSLCSPEPSCVFRVQTSLTTYYTKTTAAFNSNHNHLVEKSAELPLVIIKPRREEVSFKTTASAGSNSKAVLAFLKNRWSCNNSPYIKLRLLQDELNYYEFFDFCDYNAFNPFVKTRQIVKVVGGNVANPALKVEKTAGHSSEYPVMFEKNGTKIKAAFWGDSIEMTDSSPLSISDWEILVAGNPVVNDSWQENYIYATIANLFFAKGETISTTITG